MKQRSISGVVRAWAAGVLAAGALAPLAATEPVGPPAGLLTVELAAGQGSAEVGLRFEAPEAGEQGPRELTARVEGGSAEVALPAGVGPGWRVSASAEGFWAPELELRRDGVSQDRLVLWPAASLDARLRLPETTDEVSELGLRLGEVADSNSARKGQPPGSHEVSCPVVEQRVTGCELPAGRWNLRARAEGFAPYFLWDVSLKAGQGHSLGVVELVKGGTLVGRVITDGAAADPATAAVELRPMLELSPMATAAEAAETDQLAVTAKLDPRGYFQLSGLAEGAYQLTATQPGFAPAIRRPVEIEAGGWTELEEPIVLEPPLRLAVSVVPPVNPFGDPWDLRLLEPAGTQHLEDVAAGRSDPAGEWQSEPLPAGRYVLRVVDGEGNTLDWRDVDLAPGAEHVLVELSLVFVEGRVSLGEEPVEGTVWFGGEFGAEKIEVETGAEGDFLAVLPRPGDWRVDVRGESPNVLSRGLPVEVEPIAGLSTAEVVIELPDTSIQGEVVDELGLPAATARVRMLAVGAELNALNTDADLFGRFEVRGMPEGSYMVEAENPGQGRSDPSTVGVTDGVESPLRLVLRKERPMAGRVVGPSGPVPYAHLMAYPTTATGEMAGIRVPGTQTDPNGEFELSVPGVTSSVLLVVLAPGHPLAVTRIVEGQSLEVALGREQGTLVLGRPEARAGEVGLLMVSGQPLDLPVLRRWAQMNDAHAAQPEIWTVPAMPAGSYALCTLALQEAILVLGGAALPAPGACTEGFLPAGGELRLAAGG